MVDEAVEALKWLGLSGAGGVLCLILFWVGKFVFRKMSEESTAYQRADGETYAIKLLREELARYQGYQQKVAEMSHDIAKMHEEILELRKSNADMHAEIRQLRSENAAFSEKILALNASLSKVTGEWSGEWLNQHG